MMITMWVAEMVDVYGIIVEASASVIVVVSVAVLVSMAILFMGIRLFSK
jgi:hypothetical protein